jgi:hypothetical protein
MIRVVQQKTARDEDDHLLIPIHPAFERAMQSSNVIGLYFRGDEKGRPITSLDFHCARLT